MIESQSEFWKNILGAVETEIRDVKHIQGASGYSHPVVAVGVDEGRRRVVMISGESDARLAALAQGDVQVALPSVKVIMARPLAINLGIFAKAVTDFIGKLKVTSDDLEKLSKDNKEQFSEHIKDITSMVVAHKPWDAASLQVIPLLKEILQQLSLVEIEQTGKSEDDSKRNLIFDLSRLALLDPAEADRQMGVCSIPIYEFSENEIDVLKSKYDPDAARDLLVRHDIFQYFFPAADQLALGFAERKQVSVSTLIQRLETAPREGHPFGVNEIVENDLTLTRMIDALQDRKLLVEGEMGLEITPKGDDFRAFVRFKPRESLLAKISRILSIKIDLKLKDLFKG